MLLQLQLLFSSTFVSGARHTETSDLLIWANLGPPSKCTGNVSASSFYNVSANRHLLRQWWCPDLVLPFLYLSDREKRSLKQRAHVNIYSAELGFPQCTRENVPYLWSYERGGTTKVLLGAFKTLPLSMPSGLCDQQPLYRTFECCSNRRGPLLRSTLDIGYTFRVAGAAVCLAEVAMINHHWPHAYGGGRMCIRG